MKKYPLSLLVIIILLFLTPVYAAEKMTIAILDLQPREGVSANIAGAISDLICAEMVKTNLFTVIERAKMDEILKEQGFQQTGCTDQTCAVQIGKLLSAKKILSGEINLIGNAFMISVRIVDVEKGVAEYAATDKAASEDMLDQSASNLARKLSGVIAGIKEVQFEGFVFPEYPLSVSLSPLFFMPVGNFSDVISSGAGVFVNVSMENAFFNRLRIGVSTGYCNLSGANDRVDNAYMVPGLAVISRSYLISGQFSILPEISAGMEYSSVKYVKKTNETSTKSAVEPLFAAGLSLEYSFTSRIALQAGVNYGIIFETSGMMNFVTAKAGVLSRL